MRAKAHQIEISDIGFAVEQYQVRMSVAVSMISPVAEKSMVTISPRKHPVGNQQSNDLRQVGV
jgi:hypothetical protein